MKNFTWIGSGLLFALACEPTLELGEEEPEVGGSSGTFSAGAGDTNQTSGTGGTAIGEPVGGTAGESAGGSGASGGSSEPGAGGSGPVPRGGSDPGGGSSDPGGGGSDPGGGGSDPGGGSAPGGSGPGPSGGSGGGEACDDEMTVVDSCVLGDSGELTEAAVDVEVTLLSVEAASIEPCGALHQSELAATRFVLEATDGRRWSAFVSVADLPEDLLEVGDELGFSFEARADNSAFYRTLDQSFVLTKDSELVIFASHKQSLGFSAPPDLSAYAISLENSGESCDPAGGEICISHYGTMLVSAGEESIPLKHRQTRQVGGYSIALGSFLRVDGGGCDAKGRLDVAGFAL